MHLPGATRRDSSGTRDSSKRPQPPYRECWSPPTHIHSVIISVWIAALVKLFIVYAINVTIDWGQNFHNLTSISCVSTSLFLSVYLSFSLPLLSFLCTAALLNILHLIALQTGAFYSGLYLHGKYFAVQAGSRQLFHLSTSPFIHSPLPLAFVGIWRRFIDCRRRFWARNFCLHLLPCSGSFYMLFLEHFQQNTLRFSFLQQLRCAFKWHLKYLSWVLAHNFINAASAARQCCLPAAALCTYFACLPLALS